MSKVEILVLIIAPIPTTGYQVCHSDYQFYQ